MSRLYWGIDSNLNPPTNGKRSPRIDYFEFESPWGNYITVDCGWEEEWEVNSGHIHSGRWKDLDVCVDKGDDKPPEFHPMTLDEFEELKNSRLCEVYVEFDEDFDDSFELEMKDFEVNIYYEDQIAAFREKKIDVVTNLDPIYSVKNNRNIESNLEIQDLF